MRRTKSIFRNYCINVGTEMRRRLAVLLLLACIGASMDMTVFAAEVENTNEELTEEEKAQKELDTVYQMPVQSNEIEGWPQGPGTYGEAAIVMDVGSGAILYAKNIDDHHYPASITKVLTALVAFENGSLTDPVTFSHDCVAFMQPGDSSVGLKEGNQITLEQALYATLLASANEAAYAVGENVGVNAGHDYNWFIERMNTRCKELGGENSNFVNTNGLHDPEHYTCARDMALIGCELFKHPEFFQIVQTLEYKIPASETTEEHVFQQKHKMLIPGNSNYYEYVIGGKTGYTSDALSTLITMADNGSMQLVCVVLRTHGVNIYPDTRNLLEYAFANFSRVSVAENEKSEDVAEILGAGIDTEAGSNNVNDGYVVLPNGVAFEDLKMELVPDGGTSSGATLEYRYKGNLVGTARAVLSQSYIEEHSAQLKSVVGKDDGKSEGAGGNGEAEATGLFGGKTKVEKIVIGVAGLILVVLVLMFVRAIIVRKRKRRR